MQVFFERCSARACNPLRLSSVCIAKGTTAPPSITCRMRSLCVLQSCVYRTCLLKDNTACPLQVHLCALRSLLPWWWLLWRFAGPFPRPSLSFCSKQRPVALFRCFWPRKNTTLAPEMGGSLLLSCRAKHTSGPYLQQGEGAHLDSISGWTLAT